ncbi:MAG: DNA polymerase Y family protein, partial [Pseudomonadota bacterium]|nr:DNA polymerase Y family protein [Pseudomonadota bacterium]
MVLSSMSHNGPRITATNAAAGRLGLHPGMALADARAIHPALRVEAADEAGDAMALRRLALWCQCVSPLTRPDPPDGIVIDITGCAHLFGGEAGLAGTLATRLAGFGLTA